MLLTSGCDDRERGPHTFKERLLQSWPESRQYWCSLLKPLDAPHMHKVLVTNCAVSRGCSHKRCICRQILHLRLLQLSNNGLVHHQGCRHADNENGRWARTSEPGRRIVSLMCLGTYKVRRLCVMTDVLLYNHSRDQRENHCRLGTVA